MLKKFFLWVFIILIVLIAALLLLINPILSWSVEKGFNRMAPEITGTPTRVGEVEFSVYKGKLKIEDIFVGNPEGFSSDRAFSLDDLVLKIKPSSLASDTILIEEIIIDSPTFVLEHLKGKTNLTELKKQIDANIKSDEAPQPKEGDSTVAKDKKAKKKLAVNKLSLKDAEVIVISNGERHELELPDIVLDNFAPNGISSAQLTSRIYDEIILNLNQGIQQQLKNEASKELTKQLEGKLNENEKKGLDALRNLFN